MHVFIAYEIFAPVLNTVASIALRFEAESLPTPNNLAVRSCQQQTG
jgi:hypothetical protein